MNQVTSPQISEAEIAVLQAQLAAVRAENEALKALKDKVPSDRTSLGDGLTCKVSEKGAVSVYGLHAKFPITLYKAQWFRLFAVMAQLRAFVEANDAKLSVKAPKAVPTKTA